MIDPITVVTSRELEQHLTTFEHDGATVSALLFEGGRLSYPGRRELEHQLGQPEPYTLELEARVIHGLSRRMLAAIHLLSTGLPGLLAELGETMDPTVELLWAAHAAWPGSRLEPSPDRLVAALVAVQCVLALPRASEEMEDAAEVLVSDMYHLGFPPSSEALEELFDGAFPATVGLGLVEIP